MTPHPPTDQEWQRIAARDAPSDGAWVFGVRSTGIYCRPSCPARRPKRENVTIFATSAAAKAAGFRACLRCHPDAAAKGAFEAALVETAARRLMQEPPAALGPLAAELGLSRAQLAAAFRAQTGLTPKAFVDGQRAQRMRAALRGGQAKVTEAIYAAGFQSPSRFYEQAEGILGMSVQHYRKGGQNELIHYACAQSVQGLVLVAQSAQGLCAVLLGAAQAPLLAELESIFPKAELRAAQAEMKEAVAAVLALLEQPARGLDLPLDLRGTAFQLRVWQALRQIPAGSRLSYSELAARIGSPKAVRAVAGACAANKLAVVVPCHRITRSDGDLSGYRWGQARKRALLDAEAGGAA